MGIAAREMLVLFLGNLEDRQRAPADWQCGPG